jgi:hypothetical protein
LPQFARRRDTSKQSFREGVVEELQRGMTHSLVYRVAIDARCIDAGLGKRVAPLIVSNLRTA